MRYRVPSGPTAVSVGLAIVALVTHEHQPTLIDVIARTARLAVPMTAIPVVLGLSALQERLIAERAI